VREGDHVAGQTTFQLHRHVLGGRVQGLPA